MYKIRGRITEIKNEEIQSKAGETFEKLLVTICALDSDFEHHHQFEIFGKENIKIHKDNIVEDSLVNIEFYIKSREWNDRWFNTLMIKNISIENKEDIF